MTPYLKTHIYNVGLFGGISVCVGFISKILYLTKFWGAQGPKLFVGEGKMSAFASTMYLRGPSIATFTDPFIQYNWLFILHQTRCNHQNATFALWEKVLLKNHGGKVNEFYLQEMIYLQFMKMMGMGEKPRKKK